MLSKAEEEKVINQLREIAELTNLDSQICYWMTARVFQLLATRVVELNDECSRLHQELQKANELAARLSEKYE
jgi:hypothetical protein